MPDNPAASSSVTVPVIGYGVVTAVHPERGTVDVLPRAKEESLTNVPVASPALGKKTGFVTGGVLGWEAIYLQPSEKGAPVVLGFVAPANTEVPYADAGDHIITTEKGAEVYWHRDGTLAMKAGPSARMLMLPADGVVQAFASKGYVFDTTEATAVIHGAQASGDSLGGTEARFLLRIGPSRTADLKVMAGGKLGQHYQMEIGARLTGGPKYKVKIGDEITVEVKVELNFHSTAAVKAKAESFEGRVDDELVLRGRVIRIHATERLELTTDGTLATDGPVISLDGTTIKIGGESAIFEMQNPATARRLAQTHMANTISHKTPDPSAALQEINTVPTIKIRGF